MRSSLASKKGNVETRQQRQLPSPELLTVHREAIRRIRADYLEMPDLIVTVEQGARLWHMDAAACREALEELAREGFVVCEFQKYRRK
jgi:hypothetical protein